MRRILATAFFLSTLHMGFGATAAVSEQQCKATGGTWNAAKRTCLAKAAGTDAGGQTGPQPQEGITITGCAPSASGDPLKGLNVDKGGKNNGGQLCP